MPKRKFAAIIAVFNSSGDILMGRRRDNNLYTVPGGHREEGEEPEETAIRELKEEAGIETDNLGHLGDGMVVGEHGEHHVHVFNTVTDAKPDSSNDPDQEVTQWEWIPTKNGLPKEVYENLHVPPVKNLLFPLCNVDLVPAEFDDENWEDEHGREEDLEKAISDIPRGSRIGSSHIGVSYAYNHVLPESLRREGYRLHVRHATTGGVYGGPTHNMLTSVIMHGTETVGTVGGSFDPAAKKLKIGFSSLEGDHRGKGLGKAAYEAIMAHAKHSGANTVEGGYHSTAASAIHTAVAKKHSLDYRAETNPGVTTPGDFDDRFKSYQYLLKEEELAKGINGDWKTDGGYTFQINDKRNPDYYYLTAHHNGQQIGHVAYRKYAHTVNDHHGIEQSEIQPAHRGKGLYQEMIRQAASHIAGLGSKYSKGVYSEGFQRSRDAGRAWEKVATSKEQKIPGSKPDYFLTNVEKSEDLSPEICQFEEDVVAWCVFQEGLNKGLKHTLMGLAAAGMLTMSGSGAQAPSADHASTQAPEAGLPHGADNMQQQPSNRHMDAVIKNPTTLQPKTAGMTGDAAQSVAVPGAKIPAKNYSTQWHYQGLPKEMMAISRNESMGGKYWQHEKNQAGPFWTAYGPLGMKPATAYDEFRMPHMAAVRKAFPGLEDPREFLNEFRVNPNLYNSVATGHWNRLSRTAGGNDELAAYGWNQGIGALQNAMKDGVDVSDHDYVQKYRNHKSKLFGTTLASR